MKTKIVELGTFSYIQTFGEVERVNLLSKLPLFQHLYGNPTALMQAAICFRNKSQELGKLYDLY